MIISAGKNYILIKLDTKNEDIYLTIDDAKEIFKSIKDSYNDEDGLSYEYIYNYIHSKAEEIASKNV